MSGKSTKQNSKSANLEFKLSSDKPSSQAGTHAPNDHLQHLELLREQQPKLRNLKWIILC